jgi:hypothetical protein
MPCVKIIVCRIPQKTFFTRVHFCQINGEEKLCSRSGTNERMDVASLVSLFCYTFEGGSSHLVKHREEKWGERNMRRERQIVTISQKNTECQCAASYRRADASKIRGNVAVVAVDGNFEGSSA